MNGESFTNRVKEFKPAQENFNKRVDTQKNRETGQDNKKNFDKRVDAGTNKIGYSEINKVNTYSDIRVMAEHPNYKEIMASKPKPSPDIEKRWFNEGGSVRIREIGGKYEWTFIKGSKEVPYPNGYPRFPSEAKHPTIGDINIGKFTGDRNEDKRLYLEKLEEQYGLKDIPAGYEAHHDAKNGNMQLIKADWHKEFIHAGGHSKFKEAR